MKRRDSRPAGHRPLLSEEDRALWELAARTLVPLQGIKPRVLEAARSGGARRSDATDVPQRSEHAPSPPQAQREQASPAKARPVPALARFDRRAASRLRRGVTEIEARLDLHGMRQGEAYSALRGFLLGCHNRGLKWVLVITGKGVGARSFASDEQGRFGHEAGVLRRNVPRWLAEPDLRAVVASYESAALRHGGEGAIYVHLRGRRARHARQ